MAKQDKQDQPKSKPGATPAERLKLVTDRLNKQYGGGTIMQGGAIVRVPSWPSQIASLDIAMGCGGIPRGRIMEVFGPESSGKTTLTLAAIAAVHSDEFARQHGRPGVAAFIDAEHALDPVWAGRMGVKWSELLFSQPGCGEEALQIAKELAETGAVDLIVVDSVASLVPQAELDGEISDNNIGVQARLMSKSMRVLSNTCSKTGTTIVFINQIREKIGVTFGSNETTPGGRALRFYSSIRIDVRAKEPLKEANKDKPYGRRVLTKIVKNKTAPPFTTAEFNIIYGRDGVYGIDKADSLIASACRLKVIEVNGSFYRYNDTIKGAGVAKFTEAFKAAVQQNPLLLEELREKTYRVALSDLSAIPIADCSDEELGDEELDEELQDESED